ALRWKIEAGVRDRGILSLAQGTKNGPFPLMAIFGNDISNIDWAQDDMICGFDGSSQDPN
ncbi:hypothetical protein KI387_042933, partial [Taxus chinensis]